MANLPRLPPRRVLRWVDVATRSGSAFMITRRSSAVMPIQLAISPRVRPQPMQNWVSGSTTQILMQGVSISGNLKSSIVPFC